MDRFEAMRTLVAAIDGGSLSAASRKLNVPLPTVSRRISDLEARLGSQLLVRTTRRLVLTDAGAAYVTSARRILDELSEAERAASGEYRVPRGELTVTAPILFGKLHLAPIVHAFLAAYPQVDVRLALSDSVIDMAEARVDVALRIGALPDSALVAKRLGEVSWVIVAAPDYLARRGAPTVPAHIPPHDCIAFEGLMRHREWPLVADGRATSVTIHPRFSVNTADAVVEAAVAGLGLARVLSYQAAAAIQAGALVPVQGECAPPPLPVHLVHPPHQHQPLKLRAFLDFVGPRLQAKLRAISATVGVVS